MRTLIDNFIAETKRDIKERVMALRNSQSTRRVFLRNVMFYVMVVALLLATFTVTCTTIEGGVDSFLSISIPIFLCATAIVIFAEFFKSNSYFTIFMLFLMLFGTMLQTTLRVAKNSSVNEVAAFIVVGTIFAFFAVPIISFLCRTNKNLFIYLTLLGTVGMYLILFVLGTRIRGTLAWINIGSVSIQITEVTRMLGIMSFAGMFTSSVSPNKKLIGATLVLLLHATFLVLASELGTLLILGIVYLILAIMFLPKSEIKKMLVCILVCVMLGFIVLGICGACYNTVYGETVQEATQLQDDVQLDEDEQPTLAELEEEHGKLVVLGATVFAKVQLRIQVWLSPDKVDATDGAYQAVQAGKALVVSGVLGTKYEQYVPVIESDFVFIYVLMRFGVIIASVVVLSLVVAYVIATPKLLKNKFGSEGTVSFALLTSMIVQSLINIAMNLGLLPIIGLPLAFLSDGGSSMLVNITIMVFAIYSMRGTK